MIIREVALVLAFVLSSGSAKAQLVPGSGDQLLVCPNRPPDPELVTKMGLKESHKAILIERMYRATSYDTILETGECSCANRFPAWDTVVEYYLANYARLEARHEIQERTKHYRHSIDQNRPAVRDLCIAQDNWD
ncbi:hypothetical protein [Roseobacter sp. A03A-229]